MKIKKYLLILAIALNAMALNGQSSSDGLMGTKKLSEVKETASAAIEKSIRYVKINENDIKRQIADLQDTEKRLSDLSANESRIPAARRSAMQKQYLSKKATIVESIIESLDNASEEIENLAGDLQGSMSDVGVAESYMAKYQEADSEVSRLKSDGRKTITELEKLDADYKALDPSDSNRREVRKQLREAKRNLQHAAQQLVHRKRVSEYLAKMADFADKYNDIIANRQEQIYDVVDGFDIIHFKFKNELEMIRLQEQAVGLTAMPEGLADLGSTLKVLEGVGGQLSEGQLIFPSMPADGEESNIPSFGYDIDELKQLFYE